MNTKKKYAIPRRYEDVGDYLQQARLRKDLTQKQVADSLGYSSLQFISNFERGISIPPVAKLKVLVRLYGLTTSELVDVIQAAERRVLEAALAQKIGGRAKGRTG